MDKKELMKVMIRYLENKGIWTDFIPIVLAMADRTPGGLLELAYYVLDQGAALTQSGLVDMAMSIGGREAPVGILPEQCRRIA